MDMLEYAGLLHDIGKIAIQNDILLRVGPLTEEEWRSLKAYPNIGADIVEQLKFLSDAADVIRSHHERPDGTGYPRGLRSENIPLAARILNVVDAFDAMVSDRPYRKALPIERVIEELETYKGTQFDSEVTDIILDLHRRGEFQIIVEHMEEAGHGALQRAFEQLKQKLSAEGLFDAAHKKTIPTLPRRIGVITSPTGAAIHP